MNFTCPNCNKKFQINGKGNETFNCQQCGCRITTINGWLSSWKVDEDTIIEFKSNQIRKRKILKRNFIAISVLIFLFILWKIFISEYLDYRSALSSNNINEYEVFLNDYPGSRYYPAIYRLYDDMYFQQLKEISSDTSNSSCNCDTLKEYLSVFRNGKHIEETKMLVEECSYLNVSRKKRFNDIVKFNNDYPKSKYIPKVDSLYAWLYETLVKKYDSVAYKNKFNSKSNALFRSILKHTFDKKSGVIYIYFDKKLELKDWEEFSQEIRRECESGINFDKLKKKYSGIESLTKSPPLSLKKSFTDENIFDMEQVVINELDSTLYYLFNEPCCEIVRMQYDTSFSDNIMIKVSYKIKNSDRNRQIRDLLTHITGEEVYNESPVIWIHYDTLPSSVKRFKSYFLGICIDWKCKFIIPGYKNEFDFSDYSEPKEVIHDANTGSELYMKMTEQAFLNFTKKITSNFEIKRE